MEGRADAGPAGNGRPLASRRVLWMLEPSAAAASGKTAHRSTPSGPHSAHRDGEPLWGAPRIHGELLKLGITVSERTVSRYLPDRLTAPSQSWRTFLANHLGDLAFTSKITSSDALGVDDVVDGDVLPFRSAAASRDERCAANQWAVIDWPPSLQRTAPVWSVAQVVRHLDRPRSQRTRSRFGRDPPEAWVSSQFARRRTAEVLVRRTLSGPKSNKRSQTIRSPDAESRSAVVGLSG